MNMLQLMRVRYMFSRWTPDDLTELQHQADAFVEFYINRRWHMGLPGGVTPRQFKELYQSDPISATLSLTAWQQKMRRHSNSQESCASCRICG
jgi:hypothetical protein